MKANETLVPKVTSVTVTHGAGCGTTTGTVRLCENNAPDSTGSVPARDHGMVLVDQPIKNPLSGMALLLPRSSRRRLVQ